jgi:hypothetical protein
MTNAWVFKYDKRCWLRTQVPPCDSKHFQLDRLETFDYASYVRNTIWEGRYFLLKDSRDALPETRKHAIRYFKILYFFISK